MPRVALIHALVESIAPINAAMERLWPDCTRMNLIDDSLSSDLARAHGILDGRMTSRFLHLGRYAVHTGADGILFSCSAFGRCIDVVASSLPAVPVLKPNEAMIAEAVATGQAIGLVATFAPTLASMVPEFPASATVRTALADGGLEALRAGDAARHDELVADAASRLVAAGCGTVALAQFSMARAAPVVAARTGVPVLTTVESSVRRLRSLLQS